MKSTRPVIWASCIFRNSAGNQTNKQTELKTQRWKNTEAPNRPPRIHTHSAVLVIPAPLSTSSSSQRAVFARDNALWCGWRRWGVPVPRCPDGAVKGALSHCRQEDSTHPQPPHLSPRPEGRMWQPMLPSCCGWGGAGPQNHRRIMNATPSWQLALLWRGEEGHLWHGRSQHTMKLPP